MQNTVTSFVLSFAFLLSTNALAADPRFCARANEWRSIPQFAERRENQLSFSNPGGSLNMGLCWWHSQLDRSMIYLAAFRPELTKPDQAQAIKIISELTHENKVVEIPGYSNIYDFSHDWENEITAALSRWQVVDGFVRQKWIQNMSQKPWTSPQIMRAKMDAIAAEVNERHQIPWVMIKLPGFAAHAWLITQVEAGRTGYNIKYIDSNHPGEVNSAWYSFGDRSISTEYGNVTLTLGNTKFFRSVEKAVEKYCLGQDQDL